MEQAASLASPLGAPAATRRLTLTAGIAATAAAAGLGAAMGAQGPSDHPALVAVGRGLMVGLPLAAGLHAWHRRGHQRLGRLLVVVGILCLVTTFAESADPLAYTVGRAAGWLVELLLVYLVLAFPTGRLAARPDRLIVAAAAVLLAVLFLPRLVLAERLEVPSPYASCVDDCPTSAFFALDREPGFLDAFMRPAGFVLVLLVMAAIVVRLGRRAADATPLVRRMCLPLLVVAATRAVFAGSGEVARQRGDTAWATATSWLLALAIGAIAVAVVAGLLRSRLFETRALEHLAASLGEGSGVARLRDALARALEDPRIQVVFPAPGTAGGWEDESGRPVELPPPAARRQMSEVRHDGRVIAAIVHDDALRAEPELLEAGLAMAAGALVHERLAASSAAAVRDLRLSRARVAAEAARERRRIERDLHDGAQQRLVALRIELPLAADLIRRDPERGANRLQQLEREAEETLEEIRALAHGIHPSLLSDRGLVPALRGRAPWCRVPVEITGRGVGRYPAAVESAVYFCVLEALQNVAKHATGARRAVVVLDDHDGVLRFNVRDDGARPAGDVSRPGAGLTNMRDRMAAVGGEVQLERAPSGGTLVQGLVPVRASDAA